MASFTTRLMNLNAAAGAVNAMGLVITGHDANITSRYTNINKALKSIPGGDARMAYYDSWADLPPKATLDATYLVDTVHFNAAGATLVSQTIADAMKQAIAESSRASRTGRISRVGRG
jgi:lysophospholipase L1-like esterase